MRNRLTRRSRWALPAVLMLMLIAAGCANQPTAPAQKATATSPAVKPVDATGTVASETTPTVAPTATNANVLYEDDFTNPASGWTEAKFDNYFIGYHEPEYYHIEIDSPNSKTTVFEPGKKIFDDATIELNVLTNSKKTAPEGDFRYGPVFRRSGDQFYAFTISPRTKKWFVLKSSPTDLTVLTEGTAPGIHDLDTDDALRVDVKGSNFYFSINDQLVGQVADADYTKGEVGFFVQTMDVTAVHVHFDSLIVRNFEAPKPPPPTTAKLYEDDFTNPASGWTEAKFDNYFIGYHEPEYYHIEIDSPNSKSTVFEPQKKTYDNATIEVQVYTNSKKTAADGDFRYGPVFRRSGDQFYAFTISPRTKQWFVLKSSPTGLSVLKEGTDSGINNLDVDDALRVDTEGSNFYFRINNELVGQVSDSDYASGEVGFFVQTMDATAVHIHFDSLTIWGYDAPRMCTVLAISAKLNVRSGPGIEYASAASLSKGDVVEPLGRSLDGKWINVRVEGSEQEGWITNSKSFMSCNVDVDLLPVMIP